MYIKEITIEGFKSYATRTVLYRFSPSFNAITGLNGSGKSNILDAICFVLGISNLSQVRVHNLQQLVFNMGQTGIKKASVTIVFDNSDSKSSPVGYVEHQTITVTRQVVIGGRNKYIINGRTVLKERVTNLFHSVQLNVDNPHFLIMQGHITKVVKMRPKEILNMIEETAGTSMFEIKKAKALKSIKKKDNKLKEIQSIIDESIAPSLERRKKEQEKYVEWSRNNEKAEEMKKVTVAYDVTRIKMRKEKQEDEESQIKRVRKEIEESIKKKTIKIEDISNQIKETKSSPESRKVVEKMNEVGNQLKKMKKRIIAEKQSLSDSKSNTNEQEGEKNQIETKIKENLEKIEQIKIDIDKHKKELSQHTDFLGQLINKQGLLQNRIDGSTNAEQIANDSYSSQNQLMKVKKNVVRLESEIKKNGMKIKHHEQEKNDILRNKEKFKQQHMKLEKELQKRNLEIKRFEKNVQKYQQKFDRSKLDSLHNNVKLFEKKLKTLQIKRLGITKRLGVLGLYYHPNNPYSSNPHHHGLVGNLFRIKNQQHAKALQIIAGGKLYQHVVDSDADAAKLIKVSQRRIQVIPLNRIVGYTLADSKIQAARRVGVNGAVPAISCIEFEEKFRPAMTHIFGTTFIARTIDDAEKVAYDPRIKTRCVTLDGADFSPFGTLSGGISRNSRETVLTLSEVEKINQEMNIIRKKLNELNEKVSGMSKGMEGLDQAETELQQSLRRRDGAEQSLKESRYHQMGSRLEYLEKTIESLIDKTKEFNQEVGIAIKRRDDLENQVKILTSSSISSAQLKKEMKKTTTLLKKAKKDLKKSSQINKKLQFQQENLTNDVTALKNDLIEVTSSLEELKSQLEKRSGHLDELTTQQTSMNENLTELKLKQETFSQKSTALIEEREELKSTLSNDKLNLEKLDSRWKKVTRSLNELKSKLSQLKKTHKWISDEEDLFGREGGPYDFEKSRMERIQKRLSDLETIQKKLKLHVNRKAMLNFDQQQHEYQKLLKRKKMVEKDKEEIKKTIEILDTQKKEVILKTWKSVGNDFGRVFQTLLPGTNARLDAIEGDYLKGLEIRVSFGKKWKDSLSELSGGQRSLLALSLILSLLLYRPAPMYILDEIDAALDPSHTRNIGSLLKNEFRKSQFIVVSLKEGMFKNAEVLFTTSFHKGQSVVKRTEGEPYDGKNDDDILMDQNEDSFSSSSESESESEDESEDEDDEDSSISRKKMEFKFGGKKRKRGKE